MLKKLFTLFALCALSTSALAATVPGESAFCVQNCVNGVCIPVVTTVGTVNYPIGDPLFVFNGPGGFGGNPFQLANEYQWAQTIQANGAPTNIGGLSSDNTSTWIFGVVQAADAGLYIEIGSDGVASTAINWCVTVN